MAAPHKGDRIAVLIKDVEKVLKTLRTDVRKRALASPLAKDLQGAAGRLRKQAAAVAGQVEKYAHEIRKELEKANKKSAPKKVAPKKKKVATKKAATAEL